MRDGGLTLQLTDEPALNDIRFIEDALRAFNAERARPYDTLPLHVFLRDERGATVGGLTGFTRWEWLYIDCFWLPDDLRAAGWGSRMLVDAEDEARRRGCRHAHLYSYSFQAPGFYLKQGYIQYGTLEGYPPGERRELLRKDL